MEYSVAILSKDRVFSRMLEIECRFLRLETFCGDSFSPRDRAAVALVNLDEDCCKSYAPFSTVIGFTRRTDLSTEGGERRCSLILRRPFSMALLRRELLLLFGSAPEQRPRLAPQALCLDAEGGVLLCGEHSIAVSPRESALLALLLERRGQAVTREELAERIGATETNKTEVYICYLRRKLNAKPLPYRIVTVRGVGYRLEER